MPEPTEVHDKDDIITSLPQDKAGGFKEMAKKLTNLLAADEPPAPPGDTPPPVPEPDAPAKPDAPEPPPAPPAPTPAAPQLKTVSGLKTEPPKPDEGTTPDFTVADDEVPATIKSAKAADDFKKIKRALKEAQHRLGLAEKTLKDRESEVNTLKSAPKPTGPTQEAYEALLREKTDIQTRLETVALERSPAFQSKYKNAFDSAVVRAKAAVGEANAAQIEQLLTLPPSKYRNQQIEAIREQIETGVDKGQLDLAIVQMDSARDEMNAALAKSKETYGALAQEEQRKVQAQKEALVSRIAGMEKRALELAQQSSAFEMSNGDQEHNARASERVERVKKFIRGEANEEEIVRAAVLAEENLFLTGEYIPRMIKAMNDMEAELKAIKGSSPTTSGSTSTTSAKPKAKGFAERFREEYTEPSR